MEFLQHFFNTNSQGNAIISEQQGSDFAKKIAGDFNPIHNVGAKRFCVPGDLLFAISLSKYGLHQSMEFEFLDMVKGGSELSFPESVSQSGVNVNYAQGKPALGIRASGDVIQTPSVVENMIRKYVAFSGQNFPHILLPLMEQQNVMVNPIRPLVIYESMSFAFEHLNFDHLDLKLTDTALEVQGKRGNATLSFAFQDHNEVIGHGSKRLVLSGLKPYDAPAMKKVCDEYMANANAGINS